MTAGRIHAAKVEKSPRLQGVLNLLQDGGWHSSLELAKAGPTVAPATCVSELRSNGYEIETEQRAADEGRRRWFYRLKVTSG